MKILKIGLTGGIGAGKSTVAMVFQCLQIPVYFADDRAKIIVYQPALRAKISAAFGDDMFDQNIYQTAKMADRVFNDPAQLARLQALIYPVLAQDFDDFVRQQKAPYCIKEAAVTIETGAQHTLDGLILVCADQATKDQRLLARGDKLEHIRKRQALQWSDEQKKPFADYLIHNNDQDQVIMQIAKIDAILRQRQQSLVL